MVVATSSGEDPSPSADADLVPLDELIRRTPGAHPIDAFDTEEELEEFLAFVAESRHG